jgi:glycosyltransferase involved in cell wall biosynthesis
MSAPKKIKHIQICGAKKAGGAELYFFRFVSEMHQVSEVLPIVREGSWLAGKLADAGIPFETAPFGGKFDWKSPRVIRKLIQFYQPDLVQVWMNRAASKLPNYHGKPPCPIVGRLGGPYNLKYYQQCTHLVGNVPHLVDHIVDGGWPKDKASLMTNFAPPPAKAGKHARETVRTQYGIADEDMVLFISGRLHPRKGIEMIIRLLPQLGSSFHLILAGLGPQRETLENIATDLGVESRVHFAGWVDPLAGYAAAADIWLAPSITEPLGNTCLDAWWHEVPIIASDTGGFAWLIENNKTGLLVEPQDDVAWVETIRHLATDSKLAKKIAKAGHAHVQKTFAPKVLVSGYLKFYQKLIGEFN